MIGWKKDSWFGYTMAIIITFCCFNGGVQKAWETNFWLGWSRNHAPCLTPKGALWTWKTRGFYLFFVLKLYRSHLIPTSILFQSQKSSEKKSNPPPISKAKVTHAWHDPDIWLRRADVVAPLSMTSSGTKSWLSTSAKGWPGRRSGLRAPMSSGTSSSLTPSTTKSLPGRRSGSHATKSFGTTWAIGKTSLEKCDVWPMLFFFGVH